MLQDIRNNFQGTFAKVIIIIISIPFVIFGVESIFSTGPASSAAEVNGEKISEQQLSQAVTQYKRRLLSQMGDQFDPSMLEDAKLAKPVLDGLVEQKLLQQQAAEQGFAISKQQIQEQIRNLPSFQDDDGKFSQALFQQALAFSGLSDSAFVELIQAELLTNQYQRAWINTSFATDAELSVNARFTHETRDVRFIRLALEDIRGAINVTDEQIKAYYDANPQQFQSKETVAVEYLELKKAQFIKPVAEADLREAFEQELAAFDESETRTISHILLEVNDEQSKTQALEKMAELQQALNQGKAFAELAKEYSQDLGSKQIGGLLGPLNEEAFPAEFVEASKTLNKGGDVSEVVETDAGLHLIELTAINKTEAPTFESRKDALAQELSEANAQPEFALAVETLKDISFNAADLQEPAETLSLTVQSKAGIERVGIATDAIFSNMEVLGQLFSKELLEEKLNGEVIELTPEHAVVVRVAEHQPATLLAFDEVETQAKALLIDQEAKAELAEKSKNLMQKLEAGESVEQLAKANNLQWEVELAAKRVASKLPREILAKAFDVSLVDDKAVAEVAVNAQDIVLVEVSNIQLGQLSDIQTAERDSLKRFIAMTGASAVVKSLTQRFKENAEIDINIK